jgi:hypothetical protein
LDHRHYDHGDATTSDCIPSDINIVSALYERRVDKEIY